jgi:peptide/nickel transport system permease protein
MTEEELFTMVGIRPEPAVPKKKVSRLKGFPWVSVVLLGAIVLCCLFAEVLMTKDPSYLDLKNFNAAPNAEFLFGTDTLGRDIFSGIWYGGRISITIGFLATLISTFIAVVYGSVSGIAPAWLDVLMMRFTEIFLSVPGLLLVLFLQAVLGEANVLTLSIVIGVTGWASIAKVVRTEVRQIRGSEYVVASKCMGGRFFHILRKHLAPNFIASIMFMVVMNVRGAIGAESTLSFMGMGLPLEVISWGSMLSLAEKALLSGSWWIILIPGLFLVTLLMCLTNIGNYLRKNANRKESNL